MRASFLVLCFCMTATAFADSNVFIKDAKRSVTLELFAKKIKIMDGSVEIFKGRLGVNNAGDFIAKTKISACPEIKLSVHSSLAHGVRGTLATLELLQLGNDSRCDGLSLIVGDYTRQDFVHQ